MTDRASTAFLPFAEQQKSREGAKKLVEATIESYDSERPLLAFAVEEQVHSGFVGFCGLNPNDKTSIEECYLSQSAVLPHCAAVVSHGGLGSVMGTLAHGLPMVLLPLGADQPIRDEIAALPEPAQAVRLLEQLALERRPLISTGANRV